MLDAALRDRAAYLRRADALVVADLHLGRDAASAVELPLGERGDMRARLATLLDRFDPAATVVAGDVLDEFGRVGDAAREGLSVLAEACRAAGTRLVLVAGNHDVALADAWEGPVHEGYRLDPSVLVCHGHEEPDGDADLYVVGHDHPAIDVEGRKRPCYLYGRGAFRGGDLLMLPAFTRLAPGTAVNRRSAREFGSPLVDDADALRPIVRDEAADETLTFPPLGEFRRLL